jgi:hypothetical protein
MSLALAHALEYPGKLRLDEQTHFAVQAVQAIYYPLSQSVVWQVVSRDAKASCCTRDEGGPLGAVL